MSAGTAWAQISAGRAVDTSEAPSQEKDPRRDGTRALIPPSLLFRLPFSNRPGSREAARETSFMCALWDGVVSTVLRAGPLFLPQISQRTQERAAAAAASRQFVCDAFLGCFTRQEPTGEVKRRQTFNSNHGGRLEACLGVIGALSLIRALRRALGPPGEAAFNQGSAGSSSEVLTKVSAAAERETPFSCNLASAQEGGRKNLWRILGKA